MKSLDKPKVRVIVGKKDEQSFENDINQAIIEEVEQGYNLEDKNMHVDQYYNVTLILFFNKVR